jgi:hypothetical protein
MNKYFLNGKELSEYGLLPARTSDSNLALAGAWDMPSRTGKTHHVWPDGEGLEPYLLDKEIIHGGRDLIFNFHLKASSRETAFIKCNAIYNDIARFTGLVPFSSTYFGTHNILIKEEIKVKYVAGGFASGTLIMREPIVNVNGVLPVADSITPSIDDISLQTMGFEVKSMTDQYSRPAAKSFNVTAYGYEGYKVMPAGFRTINLELVGRFESYAAFSDSMKNFAYLLSRPNARILIHNNIAREVFSKDGFKVTSLYKNGSAFFVQVMVPLTEIRVLDIYDQYTDNAGDVLTDNDGNIITGIFNLN